MFTHSLCQLCLPPDTPHSQPWFVWCRLGRLGHHLLPTTFMFWIYHTCHVCCIYRSYNLLIMKDWFPTQVNLDPLAGLFIYYQLHFFSLTHELTVVPVWKLAYFSCEPAVKLFIYCFLCWEDNAQICFIYAVKCI